MKFASAAAALDPDAPWDWTMRDVLGLLDQRQRHYVELLPRIFRVKRADGRVVPYTMQPYQAWFHAHSPLAMGTRAPGRLVEKGRGIGLTLMASMDLLLLAHHSPRVKIPVAGRQASTGDEFIDKCWDLIQDSTATNDHGEAERIFDADADLRSIVRLGNESEIIPVAGGNPNAFRSKRAPAAALDEYAFHPRPNETWRAVRGVLSEGGQLTVLSTHDGAGTHFNELVEAARESKNHLKLFTYPIHAQDYDTASPISTQVREGRLRLIAPWLSLKALDEFQAEDAAGYEQENLAKLMDETLNLISRQQATHAHDDALESWERPLRLDDLVLPRDEALVDLVGRIRIPDRPAGNINPLHVGADFASRGDLAWYTAVETVPGEADAQRWILPLKRTDTPTQNALLRVVARTLRPTSALIDMTGGGTGLYEYAHRELRPIQVHGIHFSSTLKVDERARVHVAGERQDAPRTSVSIKKAIALNTQTCVVERTVRLLGKHEHASLQKRHLAAIRRADLDAPRKAGEGHADGFWGLGLALWGSRTVRGEPRIRRL